MKGILFQYEGEENKLEKKLISRDNKVIELKMVEFDFINPVIKINNNTDIEKYNYISFEYRDMTLYYFIDSYKNVGGTLYEYNLRLDVIQTYKDEILKSNIQVDRTNLNDLTVDNIEVITDSKKDEKYIKWDSDFKLDKHYILITI